MQLEMSMNGGRNAERLNRIFGVMDAMEFNSVFIAGEEYPCEIEAKLDMSAFNNGVQYFTLWELPGEGFQSPFFPDATERSLVLPHKVMITLGAEDDQKWIFTIANPFNDLQKVFCIRGVFQGIYNERYSEEQQFVNKLKQLAESLQPNNDFLSVSLTQKLNDKDEVLYTSPPIAAAASGSSGDNTRSRDESHTGVATHTVSEEESAMKEADERRSNQRRSAVESGTLSGAVDAPAVSTATPVRNAVERASCPWARCVPFHCSIQ